MNDTARDVEIIDSACTEGLDELFSSDDTPGQDRSDTLDISPDDVGASFDSQDTPGHPLTVQEAAELLKVSPRTVLRRLNKGALSGFKVDGTYGPEWRVHLDSNDTPRQDRSDTLDISLDDVGASFDSQDTSGQDRSDNLVSELRNQISDLKSELDLERSESQRQLQAAAFRNGYLESQLASKDEQIKLLTDSQHELGKWARFKSWFFGQ